MARKRKHEEHENHERWLVSYADFITLLFAFFVVMYSISSVNEGKYRVLSSTLVSAFSKPTQTISPINYGQDLQAPIIQHQFMLDEKENVPRIGVDHQVMPTMREIANMQKIADEVEKQLKKLIDKDLVNIHKTNKGVEIEIKSNVLFGSGQAVIQKTARPALQQIAKVLGGLKNPINVEGFTDNVPIRTLMFPSNWELSAARAANVVHMFSKLGIDPQRMSAIGYGEFKAIASNDTAEGRRRNRRINIVVLNRKEEDRKRLEALEKPKQEKLNPIGESIRKAMGLNLINKPVQVPETPNGVKPKQETAPVDTTQSREKPKFAPIKLPPPTMLPLGKRTDP